VQSICCDGRLLQITQSLRDALLEFRRRGELAPLSVDAICLNHTHISEKNEQVGMMRDVYAQSKVVVIWLGKEQKTDQSGFELMYQIGEMVGDPADKENKFDRRKLLHLIGLPLSRSTPWSDLFSDFHRPWFTRIWSCRS
jgi:hypothetical protein